MNGVQPEVAERLRAAGFAEPVPPGGYAWWYVDGVSDDGMRAFSAIFFIGSVFSPSYAARIARGERPPAEEHLGVNLALYDLSGRGRQVSWVMSEYGARELKARDPDTLAIARSSIERRPDGGLTITLDDCSAPFMVALAGIGRRVLGTIEIDPLAQPVAPALLPVEGGDGHRWRVEVPRARVRLRMQRPDFSFDGVGYHDTNRGEGRLEAAFSRWSWARFHGEGRTRVLYAMQPRGGRGQAFLVDVADEGGAREPTRVELADSHGSRPSGWGFQLPNRFAVAGQGGELTCEPLTVLEPSPFYARYLGRLSAPGQAPLLGLGEHLDLDRFSSKGIQFLLRWKTRRVS